MIGAVERMVQGPFELAESTEGDFLIYQLTGEASERLGGGDGRAIDALQLLANQVANAIETENDGSRAWFRLWLLKLSLRAFFRDSPGLEYSTRINLKILEAQERTAAKK